MRKCLILIATVLFSTSASAQQEVILDNVTFSKGDSTLWAGNTHIISLRLRDFEPRPECRKRIFASINGFMLSSPDGATWNRTQGRMTQSYIDVYPSGLAAVVVQHFEDTTLPNNVKHGNGVSPDFLTFGAVPLTVDAGLIFEYDDTSFTIEIETNLADSNLHICIDKLPQRGGLSTWIWVSVNGDSNCNVVPDWRGQRCFKIVAAECGDANLDELVNDDDLTLLIDYYFGFGAPPGFASGDVNGDGMIDIGDIIVMAQYLHNGGTLFCERNGPGRNDWKQNPDGHQTGND